jgi:hypothetical protein
LRLSANHGKSPRLAKLQRTVDLVSSQVPIVEVECIACVKFKLY